MKRIVFLLIKCFSIVLMTGAIGLELWHLQSVVTQSQPPVVPLVVFWIARFALIIHGAEGIIAAGYATRRQRSPIFHAIYTFFVGTVGLVELFSSDTTMDTNIDTTMDTKMDTKIDTKMIERHQR